jgi:Ca2+/H+ antiporter
VVVLDLLDAADALTLFVLAGAALIPLSWTIGEATDNLARHTGPGIGGFLTPHSAMRRSSSSRSSPSPTA